MEVKFTEQDLTSSFFRYKRLFRPKSLKKGCSLFELHPKS